MKAFLAGKRGICPDCDAKFIVPQHSDALAVPIDAEVPASVEPPPVVPSAPLPSTIEPPAIEIATQPLSPKLRKPRPSSRRERARRVSVALGALVLLLAVALVMVLWYQN
ncbi:MAG: hypothetical protein GXP28_10935 [Planctomycetes bacterium]|nr:hypothetical protein [Planctomycetota bacterium]